LAGRRLSTRGNGIQQLTHDPKRHKWVCGDDSADVPPDKPTWFENMIAKLGLAEHEWHTHPHVIEWVKKHRHRRYVPESLLSKLKLEVSPVLVDEGRTN